MGYRESGAFQPAEQIVVLACNVCERDSGYEAGRQPRPHLRVTKHPNAGPINDQHPPALLHASECLRAYAGKLMGPDRQRCSPPTHEPPQVSRGNAW
jgi:hypothetical protein